MTTTSDIGFSSNREEKRKAKETTVVVSAHHSTSQQRRERNKIHLYQYHSVSFSLVSMFKSLPEKFIGIGGIVWFPESNCNKALVTLMINTRTIMWMKMKTEKNEHWPIRLFSWARSNCFRSSIIFVLERSISISLIAGGQYFAAVSCEYPWLIAKRNCRVGMDKVRPSTSTCITCSAGIRFKHTHWLRPALLIRTLAGMIREMVLLCSLLLRLCICSAVSCDCLFIMAISRTSCARILVGL